MRSYYLTMTKIFVLACLLLSACNQQNANTVNTDNVSQAPAVTNASVKPDSIAEQIRPVLVINETHEIQQGGFIINRLEIDSIEYQKISMKDYYVAMGSVLSSELHLSVDKEKTRKAIAFMQLKASKAATVWEVYKVRFHLNAQAGKILYNEAHTNILRDAEQNIFCGGLL